MTIKKEKSLVSVIIVTRDRQRQVSECIKSVSLSDYPFFEIILIDNASKDETVTEIKKHFPKVKILTSAKNLGANGGKNLGQKQAKGDYFFFLDSDTVVDKKLLSELVKVAQSDPQIGMVCPKMYYFDKKDVIWYAGAYINFLTSRAKNIGNDETDLGQHDQVRETSFAPTAYLVKRIVAEELKGHGEIYFMGYVDSDYGYRIKEAGYKVMFCPKAKLWHRIGQYENSRTIRALGYNLPLRAYYFARNRVVFMKSHAPLPNFLIFMVTFFPLMNGYFLYKIIVFGGWRYLRPHLEGCFDGLRYAFGGKIKNNWV
ncbi:hypothetical protein COT64_01705 [Candidatus Shapirobacteria bacterium CG09_land_8_20_14_0_10_39_12]|uniref:Glycosyltransferase 2-like domain-containing protein n=1 Tax=Candidatus Shapirobacteria bacterium CG09_land_8_20_14_0_10_39_12 TaxID=1974885 RepID=A0A2H0WRN2_9BACT|nr:MAG: hypothetical protein COT64_01705 [Candidatus Shapirobacteria bacterium CG09_land_8_20_14_0_10_39_12]